MFYKKQVMRELGSDTRIQKTRIFLLFAMWLYNVHRCVLDDGTAGDVQRMSVRTDDVIKRRRHVGRTCDRQVE